MKLNIQPALSKVSAKDTIYVLKFAFNQPKSVEEFCEQMQNILYDEMCSSGHFRIAPKHKEHLNAEFVVGYGKGAEIKEYYPQRDNEFIVAFCVSEDHVPMNEDLEACGAEVLNFCKQVDAKVEQLDIASMY